VSGRQHVLVRDQCAAANDLQTNVGIIVNHT
jgi:hypothetical protein